MRGEHLFTAVFAVDWAGSSPHARGTHCGALNTSGVVGIIPACAGNTKGQTTPSTATRDHPRMRGEHGDYRAYFRGQWGSSPHARGTPVRLTGTLILTGIIPACAGNTNIYRKQTRKQWDHPRMRGEHIDLPIPMYTVRGSSPHARGTLINKPPRPT